MALWTLKPPSSFPPAFARALLDSPGSGKLLGERYTEWAINRLQQEWQLYRFCVRELGSAELKHAEAAFSHRTRKVFCERQVWQLLLNSHERELESELRKIL